MKYFYQLLVITLCFQPISYIKADSLNIMLGGTFLGIVGSVTAIDCQINLNLLHQAREGLTGLDNIFPEKHDPVIEKLRVGLKEQKKANGAMINQVRNTRNGAVLATLAGFGIFLAGARKANFI
ncbi:MAG TPA: hypothetical protein VFF04_07220 [Candidatus Babeliales bacterium]|nr:hypothetical protein [Candidatus Babeliales bacterium]